MFNSYYFLIQYRHRVVQRAGGAARFGPSTRVYRRVLTTKEMLNFYLSFCLV